MKLNIAFNMIKYSLLLFTLFFFSSAYSVEVKNLYIAKVTVESQTNSAENKALKSAMQAVLLKVGGQQSVVQHAVFKKALRSYKKYVTQFHYEKKAQVNILVARFNEDKINNLFQQANLPIWGRLRPQVLLWVVEENGLSRNILSDSANSTLPNDIEQFSDNRGLPINLPLMDLTDSTQVELSDVWGRFVDPIKLISARYSAEAIVVIRIFDQALNESLSANSTGDTAALDPNDANCELLCQQNNYVLDWSLLPEAQLSNIQQFSESYQGNNQTILLKQALDDITEIIYQKYALATSLNNELILDVANIENLRTYTQVEKFLSSLSSVQSIKLINAQGDSRRFQLTLIGSKNALLSSLKLDNKLQQMIDPLAAVELDAIPVFNWKKR